jgi:LmbE family N-acetylglucosaminyl deacetylase
MLMAYDILVISAHPDDAEVQMGGTLAALTGQGQRVLLQTTDDEGASSSPAPRDQPAATRERGGA